MTSTALTKRTLSRLTEVADMGPRHLILKGDLTYKQWAAIGPVLASLSDASRWWIGDWIRFGEQRHGEKYAQALDATGLSISLLQSAVWVSSVFDKVAERRQLSFGHHHAVASLDEAERTRLLDSAQKNEWSVAATREAVRAYKIELNGGPPDKVQEEVRSVGREWRSYLTQIRSVVDRVVRDAHDPDLSKLHGEAKEAIIRVIYYCGKAS